MIPLVLHCPKCTKQHVDRDEWATRPHRTHLCEHCNHTWRPSEQFTVGVERAEQPTATTERKPE